MDGPERDEIIRRLGFFRDEDFAKLIVLIIALAAETHPNELRAALGMVFDLTRPGQDLARAEQRIFLLEQRAEQALDGIMTAADKAVREVREASAAARTETAALRQTVLKIRHWLKANFMPWFEWFKKNKGGKR